jgi:hypothetical protein
MHVNPMQHCDEPMQHRDEPMQHRDEPMQYRDEPMQQNLIHLRKLACTRIYGCKSSYIILTWLNERDSARLFAKYVAFARVLSAVDIQELLLGNL